VAKKLDNSKIENIGVSHLDICISKSEYLRPAFRRDDKFPLWDGNILVYKSSIYSNSTLLGKVPVQIKTTTKFNTIMKKQHLKVKRNDLNLYFNHGGIILFKICLDNEEYPHIYYAILTQLQINRYLKSDNNKNISISLSEFPIDNILLFTNQVREYLHERNFKISDTIHSLGDIDKIISTGFNEFTISFSSLGYKNPLDRLVDQPVYIHLKNTTAGCEIPLGEKTIESLVFPENLFPIKINNKIYYNTFSFIKEKDKVVYSFSNHLQISFIKINTNIIRFNISFSILGTLSERIKDIDFIISFIKYNTFSIGDKIKTFTITEEEWNTTNPALSIDVLNNYLEYCIDIKETFDILKIKKQLDFSLLDESSKSNLRFLIAGIKYNRSQNINNYVDDHIIQNLKIGNIWVKVILVKQNDGSYKIENYFDANISGFISSKKNENIGIPVSPYVMLSKEDLTRISHIDYDNIYKSFLDIPDDDEMFQETITFILNMLTAYDSLQEKDNDLLVCSLKLTDWLLSKNAYDNSILIINKLQIIRRTRDLSEDEKANLFEIISSVKIDTILTGTYILLGNSPMAKKHYELLSQAEKKEFDGFPINIFRNFDIS